MSEGAEVGHGVLNERSKDEAEADSQVDVNGLDEAVGVGQRGPGSHHQSGHGQYRGHSWNTKTRVKKGFLISDFGLKTQTKKLC